MPLVTLFADDFSGYANQVAFENAYPYDPPGDMSSSLSGSPNSPYLTWGLTNGPGGGPGLLNTSDPMATFGVFTALVDKVSMSPTCNAFEVSMDFDFTGYAPTHPANESSYLLTVWSFESGNRSGSFDGNLIRVGRRHTSGNLFVSVGTFADEFIGALPTGGIKTLRVEVRRTSVAETSPGSGEFLPVDANGYARVSVNGVLYVNFTGAVWHGDSSTNRTWNSISFTVPGRMGNLSILHETGCEEEVPPIVDDSDVCCATGDGGDTVPTGGGTGGGAQPTPYPTIGIQLECAGGGLVPTQADIVFSEQWWGM